MADRLPGQVNGEGLELRLWRPEDAAALHDAVLANLDHLRPWMPWVAIEPLTLTQRVDLIAQWQESWERGEAAPMGMWHNGDIVGGTGYVRRHGSPTLEIGYWVHLDYLGRGFATTSTRLLTTAVFSSRLVDEIEVHHDKANARSGLVPARLGYTFVGEGPDERSAPGEVGIDCTWRMTARAWSVIDPQA
ncbi:MAG TPA: GNAT family protein [Acidimicrobiales bacterium]|nr:GNAT family protein [Acidimicrobiales bacterium]